MNNTDAQPRPLRRNAKQTRSRLLEAAGLQFATQGYRAANLRQICEDAEANLGAVRYYFGGKENLYREVLVQAGKGLTQAKPLPTLAQSENAQIALRDWIRYFFELLLIRRAAHPYMSRLVAREMAEPTGAFEHLLTNVLQPVRQALVEIVTDLSGLRPRDKVVQELSSHVLFLCLQYELARPILEGLGQSRPKQPKQIQALADRVHTFALAGILAHRQPQSKRA